MTLPEDPFVWSNDWQDEYLERVEIMRVEGVVDCERKAIACVRRMAEQEKS